MRWDPQDWTGSLLAHLAEELVRSERPLFVTGAGVSADSGLPTYRGLGGLYEQRGTDEGIPIELALSGEMFRARPEVTWKYLWQIGSAVRRGCPNRAHEVLAEIERWKPGTWVLTQNIDGYHRAAGSRQVIEVHGRQGDLECTGCPFEVGAEAFFREVTDAVPGLPPRCPRCGGVLRPRVVLFGECLPEEAVEALERVVRDEPRDLVVAVGTTGVFPYIQYPVDVAREEGVPTFEINPDVGEMTRHVEYRIAERAAVAMERLWTLAHGAADPAHGEGA